MPQLRFAGCKYSRWLLPVLLGAASLGIPQAFAAGPTQDGTFDAAVHLIQHAITATKKVALSDDDDAGQIIAALRSTHDRDLLPFFDKIRQTKAPENQIYGMVAEAILYKESQPADAPADAPSHVDLDLLLNSKSTDLVGAAFASLLDAQALSVSDLQRVGKEGTESGHRAMALAELDRMHKLEDLAGVRDLLKDKNNTVRYYAACILLGSKDPADVNNAVTALHDMSAEHDLHEAGIQALMLVRLQKQKLTAGVPWAAQIAGDDGFDTGLRFTALSSLLALNAPEGPQILSELIKSQHELGDQVKLGLVSLENPTNLKPAIVEPLLQSKSRLAKAVATLAEKAINHGDATDDLVKLMKAGDPIILNWALGYSEQLGQEGQIAIRTEVVNWSTIVDNQRDTDYRRAATAAQMMLENDGDAGRKAIAKLLQSDNRAVVEATLAGIYRSNVKNQSELVLPIWDGLTKTTSAETAANYAALILAREGHKEPLGWLPGMVAGGSVEGPGFRPLAGWYYAKLTGRNAELLKAILAD